MSTYDDLKPREQRLLMDLVAEAGFDVSDWPNYKSGRTKPAANPRYCYRWAFLNPGVAAILNLWHDDIEPEGDSITFKRNMRAIGESLRPGQKGRAREFDRVVAAAYSNQLPIQVILLGGKGTRDSERREVNRRRLDDVIWRVTRYDAKTGDCTIVRGASAARFADQFSAAPESSETVERRQTSGLAYIRSERVRERVLYRADGTCECCHKPGFDMWDGRVYLETHHIIELSKRGPDTESNVVALCPDCHKRAHFAIDRDSIRERLLDAVVHR